MAPSENMIVYLHGMQSWFLQRLTQLQVYELSVTFNYELINQLVLESVRHEVISKKGGY
jgi:hypothetical protein